MRVAKIRIQNVMGLDEFEVDPGTGLTVVEAKNGKGKTSLMEAIRSIVDGGSDATLLRAGTSEGEVVLILDDETEIRKRITEGGSTLSVKRPDVGTISSPKKYVDRIFNALSVNPIEFLTLPEKAQALAFLEALPLELDPNEVKILVGDHVRINASDFNGHALDTLAAIRDRVFESRADVNRNAKTKKGAIAELRESIAGDSGEDPTAEIEQLEEGRANARRAMDIDLGKARSDSDLRLQQDAKEIDAEIESLRAMLSALETRRAALQDEAEQRLSAELEQIEGRHQQADRERAARLEVLRERQKRAHQTDRTRQIIAQYSEELAHLENKSKALTEVLSDLDELKLSLTSKLPIKGLEIRDGALYKGDVPFRRLNKAEQVKVAIRLAQLRAGEVPLVCVDGIEALDGETFEAFKQNASKSGLQFIVTRVSPETEDAPEGLLVETGAGL